MLRTSNVLAARVVPFVVDVAHPPSVAAVADRVEDEVGLIDVWVNVAFSSAFAPADQIKPEEYRRVTELGYLGYPIAAARNGSCPSTLC